MNKNKIVDLSRLSFSELQFLLQEAKKQAKKLKAYEREKQKLQKRINKLDAKIREAYQAK